MPQAIYHILLHKESFSNITDNLYIILFESSVFLYCHFMFFCIPTQSLSCAAKKATRKWFAILGASVIYPFLPQIKKRHGSSVFLFLYPQIDFQMPTVKNVNVILKVDWNRAYLILKVVRNVSYFNW